MCSMHLTLPWKRDQPHNGKLVGGGRKSHRELPAWAAFEGPGEVGAENEDWIPTSQHGYVIMGAIHGLSPLFGALNLKGELE